MSPDDWAEGLEWEESSTAKQVAAEYWAKLPGSAAIHSSSTPSATYTAANAINR